MRTVTELMERAARYRGMARTEPDCRVREILLQVSRDYDARVWDRLRMLGDEWAAIAPSDPTPTFEDRRAH